MHIFAPLPPRCTPSQQPGPGPVCTGPAALAPSPPPARHRLKTNRPEVLAPGINNNNKSGQVLICTESTGCTSGGVYVPCVYMHAS